MPGVLAAGAGAGAVAVVGLFAAVARSVVVASMPIAKIDRVGLAVTVIVVGLKWWRSSRYVLPWMAHTFSIQG